MVPTLREEAGRAGQSGETLSTGQIPSIFSDIASTLDYAHSQGILHRDVNHPIS